METAQRLFRSPLSGGAAEPIPGTEGGRGPFFSPDGEWLGFVTVTDVKKVPMSGGAPSKIVEVSPVSQGATWMADGSVVVARASNNGLYRVASSGGPLERCSRWTRPAASTRSSGLRRCRKAEGSSSTVVRGEDFQDMASAEVVVLEPATGKRRVLMEGSTFARYVPPGWLVFVRGGALFAARLDLPRLWIEGTPVVVREPLPLALGRHGELRRHPRRDARLRLRRLASRRP